MNSAFKAVAKSMILLPFVLTKNNTKSGKIRNLYASLFLSFVIFMVGFYNPQKRKSIIWKRHFSVKSYLFSIPVRRYGRYLITEECAVSVAAAGEVSIMITCFLVLAAKLPYVIQKLFQNRFSVG
jgi:hypothetical protein